jgi:hypothetical protein
MDELVKVVVQKTGLPEAQAKQAVMAVIGFLKEKLPAPIAAQVDALLAGGPPDLAKGLGGLLG